LNPFAVDSITTIVPGRFGTALSMPGMTSSSSQCASSEQCIIDGV
jgi:hypothetical protein